MNAPSAFKASRVTPTDDPDFFPTAPWPGRAFGEVVRRLDPRPGSAWESACGIGSLAHGLADSFDQVFASDLYDYAWNHALFDFLSDDAPPFVADWIVTNPPFGDKVGPFVRKAYTRARRGVAVLLQLRALEGKRRYALFQDCPLTALVAFADRVPIEAGGYDPAGTTATAYAWFVFQRSDAARARRDGWRGFHVPPGSDKRLFRSSDLAFARGASA